MWGPKIPAERKDWMRKTSALEVDIAFVDDPLVFGAENFVSGCYHCDERASLPFDYVLDAITGCDPRLTEYLMARLANCPRCNQKLNEKSLVAVE
jgi:hypothetical protein